MLCHLLLQLHQSMSCLLDGMIPTQTYGNKIRVMKLSHFLEKDVLGTLPEHKVAQVSQVLSPINNRQKVVAR